MTHPLLTSQAMSEAVHTPLLLGYRFQPHGATHWDFSEARPRISQGAFWTVEAVYAEPTALLTRVAELEAALRDVLDLQYAKNELRTLDRGIGTATQNAAWLRARAALSTTARCTESSAHGGSQ